MFDKILIANRGEIACRVARTARRLGIGCVAVYSDADAEGLHVATADEAVRLGPAPAAESYLKIDAIIEAAQATGAQAIHPGYGFLSENADFAEACAKAGIVFIGPTAATIRQFGSKSHAKSIMDAAGVPVVPGYHDEDQALSVLQDAAAEIGYPVLIKAVAGGGGKGMRRVDAAEEFEAALAGAQREAQASFGNDRVLVEKFVARPRHIEVQIFGDSTGTVVHLFDRDCSVQRRHQKVLEEAPAPNLSDSVRAEMGAAAVRAGQAVDYVNAGTVEFISSGGEDFYFMEVNTRLQVEHPVTEFVTGHDLVEWQFRIASGDPVPLAQDEISTAGHAVEARLYAEDPANRFFPSTGRLVHVRWPAARPGEGRGDAHGDGLGSAVRVDTGVRQGDTVTPFYDPMIGKLVVWGPDREAALRRMCQALGELEIAGPATNVDFLHRVAAHPAFAGADFDTGFIETHRSDLLPETDKLPDDGVAVLLLAEELNHQAAVAAAADGQADRYSPWNTGTGWRLNHETHRTVAFEDRSGPRQATLHYHADGFGIEIDGREMQAEGRLTDDGGLLARLDGRRVRARAIADGTRRILFVGGWRHDVSVVDPLAGDVDDGARGGNLNAPLSGKVIKVLVEDGTRVKGGAPLLILEAMKMEHTISAPADGTVATIRYRVGEQVDEGAKLIDFEAEEGGS